MGSRIASLAIAFATQSVLAWQLGPELRGSYAVCQVFAGILTVVCFAGTDVAILYGVAAKRLSVGEGLGALLVIGGSASLLAGLAGTLVMRSQFAFFEKASTEHFVLALVSVPTSLFSLVLLLFSTSLRQFKQFTILSLLDASVLFVLACWFVWYLQGEVTGALWATITKGCIMTLVLTVVLSRKSPQWFRIPATTKLVELVRFGVRYYFGKLSNLANVQIGTVVLAFFAQPSEIGYFSVVVLMVSRLEFIPDTLGMVIMPRVAADGASYAELVARCARVSAFGCGLLAVVLAIFAETLIGVCFSATFMPAVGLLRILCLGVVIRCGSKVFVPFLLGIDRPGWASWAVVCGTVANVLGLLALLPRTGIPAAAISVVLCHTVSALVLTVGFLHYGKMRWGQLLLPRLADIRTFVRPFGWFHTTRVTANEMR